MTVHRLTLQEFRGNNFRVIRPKKSTVREKLSCEQPIVEHLVLEGAETGSLSIHMTPVILVPAKYFIEVHWFDPHKNTIQNTIIGAAPNAFCFNAVFIKALTVYELRNKMVSEAHLHLYRPPDNHHIHKLLPQGNDTD